ncbi:hypothetical protein EDB86DRAFT_3246882 [Lactarius hatsudake]|nr:hypothetical protein EDB86DRAFT_3246882 [Lactarius hatsudake]
MRRSTSQFICLLYSVAYTQFYRGQNKKQLSGRIYVANKQPGLRPPNIGSLPNSREIYNALTNPVLAPQVVEKDHVGTAVLDICGTKNLPKQFNS